jgi:hypothetical protein
VDEGLTVVEQIQGLRPLLAELRKSQMMNENTQWYKLWLLTALGHWIKNNKVEV